MGKQGHWNRGGDAETKPVRAHISLLPTSTQRRRPRPRQIEHKERVRSPISPIASGHRVTAPIDTFASSHWLTPPRQLLDESVLALKYGTRASDETVGRNQRSDLLKGVKLGDENSARLASSIKMAAHTDTVGEAILQNLTTQRDTITRARVSAETMEEDMDISERKMTRMACEKCLQRWVLFVIAGCVLAGIIVYAYYKLEIEPARRGDEPAGTETDAEASLGRFAPRRLLRL